MNLSRVSNPTENQFQLSAGLNLENLNPILSETNSLNLALVLVKKQFVKHYTKMFAWFNQV